MNGWVIWRGDTIRWYRKEALMLWNGESIPPSSDWESSSGEPVGGSPGTGGVTSWGSYCGLFRFACACSLVAETPWVPVFSNDDSSCLSSCVVPGSCFASFGSFSELLFLKVSVFEVLSFEEVCFLGTITTKITMITIATTKATAPVFHRGWFWKIREDLVKNEEWLEGFFELFSSAPLLRLDEYVLISTFHEINHRNTNFFVWGEYLKKEKKTLKRRCWEGNTR